jgi:hypothetical protein
MNNAVFILHFILKSHASVVAQMHMAVTHPEAWEAAATVKVVSVLHPGAMSLAVPIKQSVSKYAGNFGNHAYIF